jgi:hypothetical protein
MFAPASQIGPITPDERKALVGQSVVAGVYEKEVDRESAFEMLKARAESMPAPGGAQQSPGVPGGVAGGAGTGAAIGALGALIFGTTGPRGGKRDGLIDIFAKTATRTAASSVSRQLLRGVLGSLSGGTRRRR